jgi:alkylation response protein AidB-like acyl-CoA dehydrogenase
MRRDSPASGRCPLFTEDHEAFRELARDFVEKEVVPAYPEWEKGGRMPRDVFKEMGALGMLGMAIPEEYGGAGCTPMRGWRASTRVPASDEGDDRQVARLIRSGEN